MPYDSYSIGIICVGVLPPTMALVNVLTPRTVEVTWMASPTLNVTGYHISYTTTASYAVNESVTVDSGSTTSHTLTNLEEDTLYTITVQATTSDNRLSANSNEVSVRTYTDGKRYIISCQRMSCFNSTVPSSPPRDVMVESYNPASLMVSWRPPTSRNRNGPITGYTINYTRDGSSDVMSINVTGEASGTTVNTISGLVAYVNYSVIVAAMTVNGTGPFSDPPVVGRSGEDCELN